MIIEGHDIQISHADKILFPQDGITKGDIIDYYQRIAPTILPYLQDRPISLQRFPDGIQKSGFFQKEVPDYFPDWIGRAPVKVIEEGDEQFQVVCNNAATLVYLANQACITLHPWLSKVDRLDYPDKMIFDLDPPDSDFNTVRSAARSLRGFLEEIGLAPFVMTSGSKGLHVVVPLDRSENFEAVREFAGAIAEELAHREPDRLTTEVRKDARQGRLFLDTLRNAYAQTAVAPYTLRATPGAPVATPLDWEELSDSKLNSKRYTLNNIFRRLAQKADPWEGMKRQERSLEQARRKLNKLLER